MQQVHNSDPSGPFARLAAEIAGFEVTLTDVMHHTGVAPALPFHRSQRHPFVGPPSVPSKARELPAPSSLPHHPMRFHPLGLLLCGVVVASSACSMDATAPGSLAAPGGASMAKGGKAGAGIGATSGDRFAGAEKVTYTLTIDPQRRNLLRFGPHTLDIPARAICAAGSGYGTAAFDLACKSEKEPVTITALVRTAADGTPRIDLTPEMRFSPKRTVTLKLFVPNLTRESSAWNILFCATQSMDQCVDEAELDPSLRTHADFGASTLFRRIKHFSGYFVET